MYSKHITLPMEAVEQFCNYWKVAEMALFGSVLRDDFDAKQSDIDILVSFQPDTRVTFPMLDDMEQELKVIFNRDVDLVMRKAIEQSRNYLRRHAILSTAKVIYESKRSSISA